MVSGDTNLNENIIKYGAGADLVIHEVTAISAELLKLPAFQHIMSIHVTPSQAGTVFTRIRPKLAAYTHVTQLGTPAAPAPDIADIVSETRETYRGPLVRRRRLDDVRHRRGRHRGLPRGLFDRRVGPTTKLALM